MRIKLLIETVIHLKPIQVVYQILDKVSKHKLIATVAPSIKGDMRIIEPISKYHCCEGNDFTFLNIKDSFHSWNQTNHGMLWAYNLNYMDWLNYGQLVNGEWQMVNEREGLYWIDKFIKELPQNHIGQDPYPIALRSINWIKFFCRYPDSATKTRLNSLYSQVKLLERKLEYKLLGNHLLEDACALFIASVYFNEQKLYAKALKLLKEQLKEQILPDGAHYEQSPMYHCILLDRLLDCVNFSKITDDTDSTDYLSKTAQKMLGHLESVVWEDGSIPLLNDSAYEVAPTSEQIFDYARRLGLEWKAIPLKECGYRKLKSNRFEAIVDVGDIKASYQSGHSHADTFSYELRVDGVPFIVDTGISTYNKTSRRQYERSSKAHNTVTISDMDSSRVWGGFRVGKRAEVHILKDEEKDVMAEHDGFGKSGKHYRQFMIDELGLHIIDNVKDGSDAVSYIHFAPGLDVTIQDDDKDVVFAGDYMIVVNCYDKMEIMNEKTSTAYNQFQSIKVLAIHFNKHMEYTIVDES